MRIAHLHVWDKKNKGDVAIVLAVQEQLRKRFPGCRIEDFPVSLLKAGERAALEKINRCDLVVIGGGGIFYSYFLPYDQEFITAIKKPIVLFGVGYIREIDAPEIGPEAAQSAVALVEKAKAVGVRDYKTKAWLIGNGAASRKIKVIGDPAALLEEKRPPAAISQKMSLGREAGVIRIGFNLNYSGWLGFGKWREDILSAYRSVADYFLRAYGGQGGKDVRFYYLQHHPGEKNIYPELNIQDLRVINLEPAAQKYVYGQLDLVVGMMLHAGVLAFGAGTPEVSAAYDLRNHSFAEFIDLPELVVDMKELKGGGLLERVETVFRKQGEYENKFSIIKKNIYKKQKEFLNHL